MLGNGLVKISMQQMWYSTESIYSRNVELIIQVIYVAYVIFL